ncbi:recombinase family protein [Nocardiopsis rhodophaea]
MSASQYANKVREDWERLLADLKAGKIDVLVVWEISRATRERLMWATMIIACQEQGCLVAVDGKVYDTRDPDDMSFLDFLFLQAVRESGLTHKRVSRTHAHLAAVGHPVGKPPYGYRHKYDPSTGRLIARVVDEKEAVIVREIVDRVIAGEAPGLIVGDLNRRGLRNRRGKPFEVRSIQTLLRLESLGGKRVHHGTLIEVGGWESVLAKDRYGEPVKDPWAKWLKLQRALDKLKERGGGRADSEVKHLASNIAVCDVCEGRIRRGMNAGIPSYKCYGLYKGAPKLGCVSRKQEHLDLHITQLLVARMSMPDLLDLYTDSEAEDERLAAARRQLAEVEEELEEAYQLRRAGKLSIRALSEAEEDLLPKIADLREKAEPKNVEPLMLELWHPDPEVVLKTWNGWRLLKQRDALRKLARRIAVKKVGRCGHRKLEPSESVAIEWV